MLDSEGGCKGKKAEGAEEEEEEEEEEVGGAKAEGTMGEKEEEEIGRGRFRPNSLLEGGKEVPPRGFPT
ncbi:MAG: hypothetical protein AAFP77_31765, partial [Bacteroidota bacterium]